MYRESATGCVTGFLTAAVGLIFFPALGALLGFFLSGGGNSIYTSTGALIGFGIGVALGLWNAITVPARVRRAKNFRRWYRNL